MFTVSPGAQVHFPPDGMSPVDSGIFSEDLSVYYFGHAVLVDPFSALVVNSSSVGSGGDLGVEPVLHDFLRGGLSDGFGWV